MTAMPMTVDVKICGLRTAGAVEAAVSGGARFLGFVFFHRSPRSVSPHQVRALASGLSGVATRVGLVVDAGNDELEAVVGCGSIDMLQLHGAETPARTNEVRARFSVPVMKAVAIGTPADLQTARAYEEAADRLLFDACPPANANRPGGNAVSLDWPLLRSGSWRCPWMLAGGLDESNLAEAVRASGACAVDVSSGVEDGKGVKSAQKIARFLQAAAALSPPTSRTEDLADASVGVSTAARALRTR